ncbi:hypothetical protein ACTXPC_14260 [Brachybacterium alimentarium]
MIQGIERRWLRTIERITPRDGAGEEGDADEAGEEGDADEARST